MRSLTIIVALFFVIFPARAYYPNGVIKLHNAKLLKRDIEKLGDQWLAFLQEEPDLLKAKDKDYKVDQYCSFTAKLDADGHVDLNSLKLLKHKDNFAYNLRAIEFLRANTIVFEQKNNNKDIEIEFKYFAF